MTDIPGEGTIYRIPLIVTVGPSRQETLRKRRSAESLWPLQPVNLPTEEYVGKPNRQDDHPDQPQPDVQVVAVHRGRSSAGARRRN